VIGCGLAVGLALTAVHPAHASLRNWRIDAPLPEPRARHALVRGADFVYLIGGSWRTDSGRHVTRGRINPDGTLGPWERLSDLNVPREQAAAAIAGNWIFVVGGRYPATGVQSSVERAPIHTDGSLGDWIVVGSLPRPRYSLGLEFIDRNLYVIGGRADDSGSDPSIYPAEILRAPVLADGSLDPWQTAGTLPFGREGLSAFSVGRRLFVTGGFNAFLNSSLNLSAVVSAPVAGGALGRWQAEPGLQLGRASSAVVSTGQRVYVLGGAINSPDNSLRAGIETARVSESGLLSPWAFTASMPEPRLDHSAVRAGNRLFVIGGSDAEEQRTVFSADIVEDEIIRPPTLLPPVVQGSVVSLTWDPSPDAPNPLAYLIEVGRAPGLSDDGVASVTGFSRGFAFNLAPGAYYIRVRVQTLAGISGPSTEYLVVVGASGPPGPPRGLTAGVTGSTVTLAWQPPDTGGATQAYVIEVGNASGVTNTAVLDTGSTATSFQAAGVPNGIFFIRLRARNTFGVSAPSNEVSIRVGAVQTVPGAPSGLTASVDGGVVTLHWQAPDPGGAPLSSYLIEVGGRSGSSDLGVFPVPAGVTRIQAAVPAGTYFVRVRATNAFGVGPPSAEVMVQVPN
jgi:N-acetylneuraminic acid mutarotase